MTSSQYPGVLCSIYQSVECAHISLTKPFTHHTPWRRITLFHDITFASTPLNNSVIQNSIHQHINYGVAYSSSLIPRLSGMWGEFGNAWVLPVRKEKCGFGVVQQLQESRNKDMQMYVRWTSDIDLLSAWFQCRKPDFPTSHEIQLHNEFTSIRITACVEHEACMESDMYCGCQIDSYHWVTSSGWRQRHHSLPPAPQQLGHLRVAGTHALGDALRKSPPTIMQWCVCVRGEGGGGRGGGGGGGREGGGGLVLCVCYTLQTIMWCHVNVCYQLTNQVSLRWLFSLQCVWSRWPPSAAVWWQCRLGKRSPHLQTIFTLPRNRCYPRQEKQTSGT